MRSPCDSNEIVITNSNVLYPHIDMVYKNDQIILAGSYSKNPLVNASLAHGYFLKVIEASTMNESFGKDFELSDELLKGNDCKWSDIIQKNSSKKGADFGNVNFLITDLSVNESDEIILLFGNICGGMYTVKHQINGKLVCEIFLERHINAGLVSRVRGLTLKASVMIPAMIISDEGIFIIYMDDLGVMTYRHIDDSNTPSKSKSLFKQPEEHTLLRCLSLKKCAHDIVLGLTVDGQMAKMTLN